MQFDVETLSRIQFSLTIMFHYLFPPLSIGLGWFMVCTEGLYLKTGKPIYGSITRFWTKIFAVNFAMGVATGIVMEFQFGTNWATYSRFVGDVFGSALAAEGIFAFFLESGFLAVVVFGWDRVSRRMHFFSTFMVALGATFSAIWIVVANSWQQTPAGFHIVGQGANARAEITDFWAMVFNPSSMHRLGHVLLGALVLSAFFVMSISAYYVLRRRYLDFAKTSFTVALVMGVVASLAVGLSGDLQAKKVAQTQPAKLAAFEGHFTTAPGGTPLYLFGVPDVRENRVKYGLAIPGLLSWLVSGDAGRPVTALDAFPPEDRPPVGLSFQSYHLMVAIGGLCIVLTLTACFFWWRGTLFGQRWLMRMFVASVLAPYVANQTGWVAAEVGRQPWIVYGLLRTSEGLSKVVQAEQVLGSIIMFSVMYGLLFVIWVYVLNDKIHLGPEGVHKTPHAPSGFLDAAAELADPARGHSLTLAHGPEAVRDGNKES